MRFQQIALTVSVFLCAAQLLAEKIALVKDHQAKSSIVLAADASEPEKFAAETLQKYVERITGAKLEIAPAPKEGLLPIHLGVRGTSHLVMTPELKEADSRIRDDGFAVDISKERIQITGPKKRSVIYGASYILQKYGEVIWFYASNKANEEEAEHCPKSPDFTVETGIQVKNPDFSYRRTYNNGGEGTPAWLVLNGQQVFAFGPYGWTLPEFNRADPIFTRGGHDLHSLVCGIVQGKQYTKEQLEKAANVFKEHPEYYGLGKDGERKRAGNNMGNVCQPCTSNPDALKIMAAAAIESLEDFHGHGDYFRDFSNDDHTSWCQCENCKKLDLPLDTTGRNREGNRWWHFINYMADAIFKADPDADVQTLVYQTYRYPPTGVKPDKRVRVAVCPHHRCYVHSLDDPRCSMNEAFREMFTEWTKIGQRTTSWEYFGTLCGYLQYIPLERAWIDDLRFYKKNGVAGYQCDAQTPFYFPYWILDYNKAVYTKYPQLKEFPLDGRAGIARWQQYWLSCYFSWNIDDDYDKVYEYVNSRYYGAGWKYMKEYRAELIAALYDSGIHIGYEFPNRVLGKCFERPGFPEKLYKLLDQAEAAVKDDRIRTRRIARDRAAFQMDWVTAYEDYNRTRQSEYNAKARQGEIVIDGKLDEPEWKDGLGFITSFAAFQTEKPATVPTYARILFDKDNVYFGIDAIKAVPGKNIPAAQSPFDKEHIELFIAPPSLKGRYVQISLTPDGKFYESLASGAGHALTDFRSGFTWKAMESPEKWTLEVKVPVKEFTTPVRAGAMWKINIGRSALLADGTQEQSSAANGAFHDALDLYRTVVMGESGPIFLNGDFEQVVERKPAANHPWRFADNKQALGWYYNETSVPLLAEIRSDNAPSGKNYLRVKPQKKGGYIMLGQVINPKNFPRDMKKCELFIRARGKGSVKVYLSSKGRLTDRNELTAKVNSPEQWQTFSKGIDVPEDAGWLWISVTTDAPYFDIDDFRLTPIDEVSVDDMPTAVKAGDVR